MNLHLAIPDLWWPEAGNLPVYQGLAVPALQTLLAKGRVKTREGARLERWLLERYGVESGSAPYALAADGGQAEDAVWMRADPCHLRVMRDRLVLTDATTFDLEREEAEALVEALNRHFAEDGLVFYPMQPERWYVRLPAMPVLQTVPLDEARGRDIDSLLPGGDEAMRWRSTLNEIQMLLYQHPVNDAREERGAAPVNSVWFWGAGTQAAPPRRPYQRVRTRDPLAAGLAQTSGASVMPLPDHAQQWLKQAGNEGVELVVLDQLAAPAGYGQEDEWRTRLEALDRDWFAPLLDALRRGRIGMITLHLLGRHGCLEAEITRQDLRYFWRRAKPLSAYLA
ncbi:MAG: hypothetical protein IRY96_01345 [Burkholderiales bacterium]|nr:hypothetical protein [Burkholderiales bacterium]